MEKELIGTEQKRRPEEQGRKPRRPKKDKKARRRGWHHQEHGASIH